MVGQLRSFHGRSATVLSTIDEGVVILDRDWTVLYINDAGAHSAGRTPREMIGQNYWEVVPEARETAVEQHLRRCALERLPIQFEFRTRRSQRSLNVRVYPVPEGICFFFQDVSDAKEREAKLRNILNHLTTAHRAAQNGTWEWNIRTNEAFWSDEIPHFHAIPPEQFDGKLTTWIRTVHPDDVAGVRARVREALRGKEEYNAEFRVVHPNAEVRWVSCHARVLKDQEGKPERMVGVTSDITERRAQEEVLRRSEKLAAAGRLAATIAHEINNPLEAVTNLVYLMRQDTSANSNIHHLLRQADEQLARVNHIAKQTLGFYQDHSVSEKVDLVHVLDDLLVILQSRLNAKQIRMEREYENACFLDGFRDELRQVFSNLLTNAIDASPSGGRLIVRVKPELSGGGQVTAMRVEVEDFGAGIRPEDQRRIFEPFFTTKLDVGTGLGLWASKGLVEKRGGVISFRCNCLEDGSGTCFSVVFPTNMAQGAAQAAAWPRLVS